MAVTLSRHTLAICSYRRLATGCFLINHWRVAPMMLLLEEFTADIPCLEQQLKQSDGDTMWGGGGIRGKTQRLVQKGWRRKRKRGNR